MEQVTANVTGRTRRATLHGREHIVAPMTLIVPGVLNGSKGPLYYPPEEVSRDPAAWNHVPIVVYHPQVDGLHVSARDPDVLNGQGVGIVLHARSNGKLTAEAWFDVEATRRIDNRILQALEAGKPIELSTGLFTDNEPAQDGANYNGKPYSFIARNYRPDHLAVLPDQVGACSVQDGCGVLVNEQRSLWQKLGELLGVNVNRADNAFCATGEGGGIDPGCSPGEGGRHQDPKGGGASRKTRRDVKGLGLELKQTHQIGTSLASSGEDVEEWIKEQGIDPKGQRAERIRKAYQKQLARNVEYKSREAPSDNSSKGGPDMADKKMSEGDRKKIVDDLIANVCCWEEEDRETLNKFSDERLTRLVDEDKKNKAQEAVVNAVRQGTKGLKEAEGLTVNAMPAFIKKAIEAKKAKAEGGKEPCDPEVDENCEEEEEVKNRKPARNRELTDEQWLKSAPPRIRSAVRNAMAIEGREKVELIDQLTANVKDEETRSRIEERLQDKPLDELRELALLLPEPMEAAFPSYAGAAAPAFNRQRDVVDKESILALPTIDWSDAEKVAV